jgi:hypothetical protein
MHDASLSLGPARKLTLELIPLLISNRIIPLTMKCMWFY